MKRYCQLKNTRNVDGLCFWYLGVIQPRFRYAISITGICFMTIIHSISPRRNKVSTTYSKKSLNTCSECAIVEYAQQTKRKSW